MRYLTLDDAKRHLNVEHSEDDAFIESLIDSAEDYLGGLLNRDITELEREDKSLPPALLHALRIIVGRFYADREGYRMGRVSDVSFTIGSLIGIYRLEK